MQVVCVCERERCWYASCVSVSVSGVDLQIV